MKRIYVSIAVSLLIVLAGMFVNYRSYQEDHHLKYSIRMHGGEITIEHGFGLEAVHIYAMEPGGHDSHRLRFDPIGFLLYFAVIAVIVFAVSSAVSIVRKKR